MRSSANFILLITIVWPVKVLCSVRVNLATGTVEGFIATAPNGASALVFLGIPYAQPPVGRLRFAKPVPAISWKGIRRCKEYTSNCWQHHKTIGGEYFNGTEDCLYLNVFSALNCTACPVLYYIHGGGFDYDTPSAFSTDLLIENFVAHGLVLVTLAYRLNVFGFWAMGEGEARGNYGIYDTILGLQWVQKEIHNFGGDADKVTIMGHSSGGTIVSLLTQSPRISEGLFHQAIMLSGNAVDGNALNNNLTVFQLLATSLGCADHRDETWTNEKNHWSILQCMRRVDADTMGRTYLKLKNSLNRLTRPCNDGPLGLFPVPIDHLLSARRPLPVITGTTETEAPLVAFSKATLDTVLSSCRSGMVNAGLRNERAILSSCYRQYVWPLFSADSWNETIDNCSISLLARQTERVSSSSCYYSQCYKEADSLRRKGAKVYLYSFDYHKSGQECFTPYHAFDMTYLIGIHRFPFDQRDHQIRRIYSSVFANFVKNGDPSTDSNGDIWTPLESPFGFNYYSIDLPEARMKEDYHKEDIIFWNYLVPSLEKRLRTGTLHAQNNHSKSVRDQGSESSFWVPFFIGLAFLCAATSLGVRMGRRGRRSMEDHAESIVLLDGKGSRYSTFSH